MVRLFPRENSLHSLFIIHILYILWVRKRRRTKNVGQHYNISRHPTISTWMEKKHNSTENNLLGGNFDLSISMATTFIINTHIGLSNMSGSFFTKLIALKHWHSRRLRSGYALRNSLDTFCWNFFMSNNWKKYKEWLLLLTFQRLKYYIIFHCEEEFYNLLLLLFLL